MTDKPGKGDVFLVNSPDRGSSIPVSSQLVRFGLFELDVTSGELWKAGRKIKLQEQPFRLLCLLLEQPGEAVTREQLIRVLWPADTYVDFDHSLNAAVAKVRQVLGDSAENPRFVETLARRGYRFIAPVEITQGSRSSVASSLIPPAVAPPSSGPDASRAEANPSLPPHTETRPFRAVGYTAVAALTIAILLVWGTRAWRSERNTTTLVQLTTGPGLTMDPAVSPDGKLLAYVSDGGNESHLNLWIQQLSPGGSAIQLTHSDFDTAEPSFSPEGNRIAFHSAENGGGIYTIPAIGGEPTFVAAGGRSPRFSPNGKWITYWSGVPHRTVLTGGEAGQVYVVQAGGGTPRPVASDLPCVGNPIWSPDSEQLMFSSLSEDDTFHWAVASVSGERSHPVNTFDSLKQQGFVVGADQTPRLTQWIPGYILFSAWHGDAFNVWRMPISEEGQSKGLAERLTSGTTLETSGQLTRSGSLIFASLNLVESIWSLPLDANRAKVEGELTKLTNGPVEAAPAISLDGRKVAYQFSNSAHVHSGLSTPDAPGFKVRLKDLLSKKEHGLPDSRYQQNHPQLSSDGNLISIASGETIQIFDIHQWPARKIAETKGGKVWDWSPDNKRLLIGRYPDPNIDLFDVATGRDSVFLAGDGLFQSKFSPDNAAVALVDCRTGNADCRIQVVPLDASAKPAKDGWITINHPSNWDDKPGWSPDGGLLYFVSNRDGRFCLWAQRLQKVSKQPIGEPFAVYHFHNSRLLMDNVGTSFLEIDVAKDNVVLGLGELTGNLWTLTK